jgi:hypothetical protein
MQIKFLLGSDLLWLVRFVFRVLLWKWHTRSIQPHLDSNDKPPLPTGPYLTTRKHQMGDLLLWVPRRMESYLIDDLTGGYGYSHSTIDTGEIDIPTQKSVMVEILQGQTVMRKFQDQYAQRPFVRVPLSKTGINPEQFMDCVRSKIGEPYDNLEIITLGKIQNPGKEVCSGVASDCLPEDERERIACAKKKNLLRKGSVSVNSKPGQTMVKESITPNGFAQYYGAPQGRKLNGTDILVEPHPIQCPVPARKGWRLTAGIMAFAMVMWVLFSRLIETN